MIALTGVSFLIWCYLWLLHGRFWNSGPELPAARPQSTPTGAIPAVAIIVPARDEAAVIARCLRSLLAQNYEGPFRVILVDDQSTDRTKEIALDLAGSRLTVINGAPRPDGWAGKLWAVSQGIAAAGEPAYVLLTDADIEHDPAHLSSLVAAAETRGADGGGLDMVSEMVALSCDSPAEKTLVPAFVFFFQLLYPFALVNNPGRKTAAAAGGTILIRREALTRIGGIQAVRGALIDDVALAGAVKAGGPIFLGHSGHARSIRPYPGVGDIWRMVARSAYAQLRFSPLILAGTVLAMVLVWLVPACAAIFSRDTPRYIGLLTWVMMSAAYIPTLNRFQRSWLWAPVLPLIALFYLAATISSAVNHHRGVGVVWKGRAYTGGKP